MQGQGATGAAPRPQGHIAGGRAAWPSVRESAQRGRPDLRRRAPPPGAPGALPSFGGSRMQEGCVSPPCVGGREGGALAKNPRRQPVASAASRVGRSPAPTTVGSGSPAARPPALQKSPAGRGASEPEAGSWQGHASMRPPSGPWLVLPGAALWPPRLYPGHQAAGRSPRLQRSLAPAFPSSALSKGLTSSCHRKVLLSRPGGRRPRDGERAAARSPSAAGHVEGESPAPAPGRGVPAAAPAAARASCAAYINTRFHTR